MKLRLFFKVLMTILFFGSCIQLNGNMNNDNIHSFFSKDLSITMRDFVNKNMMKQDTSRVKKGNDPRRGKVIVKMVRFLLERKTRKVYRDALEKQRYSELSKLVSGENENNNLKHKPVVYYITKALLGEERFSNRANLQDTIDVCLDYLTAFTILNEPNLMDPSASNKSRDNQLLDKIQVINTKNNDQLGIDKAGGINAWLKRKCKDCDELIGIQGELSKEEINKLKAEKEKLQEEIQNGGKKILSLVAEIEDDSIEVEQLATRKEVITNYVDSNSNVKYNITDLDKDKIDKLAKAVSNKNTGNLTAEEKALLHTMEVIGENESPNLVTGVKPRKIGLGAFCSADIESTYSNMMDLLLHQVTQIPKNNGYREKVEVQLRIKGYADGLGAGGVVGSFTPKQDIRFRYINKNDIVEVFNARKGHKFYYTNEQLAFLRAWCAYESARILLNSEGINKIEVRFYGIEQEKITDKKGDPLYRGVDISFVIKDAFTYLTDEIKEIDAKTAGLIEQMKAKRRKIGSIREEIYAKEQKISGINLRMRELEERLLTIEMYLIADEVENRIRHIINLRD